MVSDYRALTFSGVATKEIPMFPCRSQAMFGFGVFVFRISPSPCRVCLPASLRGDFGLLLWELTDSRPQENVPDCYYDSGRHCHHAR